jgi:hypothetical protein
VRRVSGFPDVGLGGSLAGIWNTIETQLEHSWDTVGTQLEHSWNTDGTQMEHVQRVLQVVTVAYLNNLYGGNLKEYPIYQQAC